MTLIKFEVSFRNPGGTMAINNLSWTASGEKYQATKGIDPGITRAWKITTGSKSIVVAILDDGFCYTHADLIDNIWHNPGEGGIDNQGFDKAIQQRTLAMAAGFKTIAR
jgi:hypothetical protein